MINFWNLRIANSTNIAANAEITDLELPKITRVFDTDRRVGYAGSVPLPTGFDEMELTFTTTAISPDFRVILSSLGEINFVFTGCEQSVSDSTFDTTTVICTGMVEENPLGTFETSSAEFEVVAKISYIEVQVNGVQLIKYNPRSYEYLVNGVNQMAEIRNSLGV